ncbi:MAG: hypothetical protein LBI71_11285 [Enterobacteriaceae bacterium]|jgi:hypothetical protein|nr:hypothetical protein [Enterobacteriaceae bacterium]
MGIILNLKAPTFPQAVNNVIDVGLQKDQNAKYIVMEVPQYSEATGDLLMGFIIDLDTPGILLQSAPSMPGSPNNNYLLLFPIENFTLNGHYEGYYSVTRLSTNISFSPMGFVTINDISGGNPIPTIPQSVSIPQATGDNGTLLTQKDYSRLENLTVIVPSYTGMAPEQQVSVEWKNENQGLPKYITDPQITQNYSSELSFSIPRMQYIDCIGSIADITFKVIDKSNQVRYSALTRLYIEGQTLDLPKPALFYRPDGTIHVIIEYNNMSSDQTVEIRAVGTTQYQSPYQTVTNFEQMAIQLPQGWVNQNMGQIIYIDYAVGSSVLGGVPYNFSRILRIKLGQS